MTWGSPDWTSCRRSTMRLQRPRPSHSVSPRQRPTAARRRADPMTTPPTPRKLHAGHFAFTRAVVQGLDARAMWERYLRIEGVASDVRVVRSTTRWICDAFAAVARREQRPGTA